MRPKVPAACADLDLAEVSRVLAKHYGDIPAAARELAIPIPDLRRLIWAKPKLLEEAELERMGVIARAMGVVIQAVYSDDPRRRMWGCDKLLSSWLARDHPLAPARRGRVASAGESCTITFRWQGSDGKGEDPLERDGRTLAVPSYGDLVTPPAPGEAGRLVLEREAAAARTSPSVAGWQFVAGRDSAAESGR